MVRRNCCTLKWLPGGLANDKGLPAAECNFTSCEPSAGRRTLGTPAETQDPKNLWEFWCSPSFTKKNNSQSEKTTLEWMLWYLKLKTTHKHTYTTKITTTRHILMTYLGRGYLPPTSIVAETSGGVWLSILAAGQAIGCSSGWSGHEAPCITTNFLSIMFMKNWYEILIVNIHIIIHIYIYMYGHLPPPRTYLGEGGVFDHMYLKIFIFQTVAHAKTTVNTSVFWIQSLYVK